MTVSVDDTLSFFAVQYPYIPVQSKEDKANNFHIEMKYLSYDRFKAYYDLACDEFESDCLQRGGLVATDNQTNAALAHLIADYCEMTNPDWSYREQSVITGEGLPQMRIQRGPETSPRAAYNKLLDIIMKACRHAPKAYNGSANVEPMFYRGMMTSPYGIIGYSPTNMRIHKEIDDLGS